MLLVRVHVIFVTVGIYFLIFACAVGDELYRLALSIFRCSHHGGRLKIY